MLANFFFLVNSTFYKFSGIFFTCPRHFVGKSTKDPGSAWIKSHFMGKYASNGPYLSQDRSFYAPAPPLCAGEFIFPFLPAFYRKSALIYGSGERTYAARSPCAFEWKMVLFSSAQSPLTPFPPAAKTAPAPLLLLSPQSHPTLRGPPYGTSGHFVPKRPRP